MADLLHAINNTPVPNLLIVFGGILLCLAFIGKFGTYIELPAQRQRWAGVVGIVLLLIGTSITVISELRPEGNAVPTNTKAQDTTVSKDTEPNSSPPVLQEDFKTKQISKTNLGRFMPDLTILPGNLSLSKSGIWTSEEVLSWNTASSILSPFLENEEYTNVYQHFSSRQCSGKITHASFSIHRFANREEANAVFTFWKESDFNTPSGLKSKEISKHIYTSNKSSKCKFGFIDYSQIDHRRVYNAGNVIMTVILRSTLGEIDEREVQQLSKILLISMSSEFN